MSLYNMLFGVNPLAGPLLATLGLTPSDVPRFRDCFIHNGEIVIHTRTGGGNRDFYQDEETHNADSEEGDYPYDGPWNEDLVSHTNYLRDEDDDSDCTYANFYFSFPAEYAEVLKKIPESDAPADRWQTLLKEMEKPNENEPPLA